MQASPIIGEAFLAGKFEYSAYLHTILRFFIIWGIQPSGDESVWI